MRMDVAETRRKIMQVLRGGEPNWSLRAGLFLAVIMVFAALLIAVHIAAGLTLPVPWGDEAYFIWQARAFERWNDFIAPELDPERPLLLLPYGYPLLLGIVFKVFGYSLETARAVSLIATLCGFGLLATAMRARKTAIVSLILIGAFMMNAHFVAMANNARMEAVVFAVICAALLLIQNKRSWIALGLLGGSAMIHPNVILMGAPVFVYAVFADKLWKNWPDRWGWTAIGIGLLAWFAQGVYVLSHWEGFEYDLAYRMLETTSAGKGTLEFGGSHGLGLVIILAIGALAWWRKVPVVHLIAFAVGGWLMSRVRAEQWYEIFYDFAYLLAAIALIEVLVKEARQHVTEKVLISTSVSAGLLLVSLGFFLKTGRIEGPKGYFHELTIDSMVMSDGTPYFTDEDEVVLEAFMKGIGTDDLTTVEYYPWGDALLFPEAHPDKLRFQMSYFDPAYLHGSNWPLGYGPTPMKTPDLYILRTSRYQPPWLDARFDRLMARASERSGGRDPVIIHSRDDTEIWYAFPTSPEGLVQQ
jgi:hypothetical protein